MKLLKIKYIYIIFIILIIVDYFGLYQWNKIKVDDISISKPIGYKYSSVVAGEDSIFHIFKNTMGLITNISLLENRFLRLKFENMFFMESTTIVFFKLNDVDKYLSKKNTNLNLKH